MNRDRASGTKLCDVLLRSSTLDRASELEDSRLRATAATGHRWRRCRPIELGRVVVHLPADGGSTFGTDVVVLVAARENEQQLPPRWGCAATLWAEETRRLKLGEAVGRAHSQILRTDRRGQYPKAALKILICAYPATARDCGYARMDIVDIGSSSFCVIV